MIVAPKSGCRISRKATTPVSTADSGTTGSDLSCSLAGDSSQAMATTKKGLRNSDGWNWPTPKLDPAPGAVHLRADDGHEDQQHEEEGRAEQRQAPRALARQHRDADHHRHADARSRRAGGRNNRARRSGRCRPNSAAPPPARRRRPRSGRSPISTATSSSRTRSISQNQRPTRDRSERP